MAELNSQQRSYLKGLKMDMDALFQIGKASLTPDFTAAIDEALAKRELLKISVLKNCTDDPLELANTVAERTHSAVVQVIGRKIVLYRPAKKPKIELPVRK